MNLSCVKRTFHIAPDSINKNDVLLCELSQNHISMAWADAASKNLKGLSYYDLRNLPEPEKLQELFTEEDVTVHQVSRVVVSSAFKNVVLVPLSQFTEEAARRTFASMYSLNGDTLFFDEVPAYNLMLVHALPQDYMKVLKSLQLTETVHSYGCMLRSFAPAVSVAQLNVHFTGKEFQVAAVKEEQLKLVQTYFYTAPLDVVYYLLSICQQYDMEQSSTALLLSGLISEDSAMFKELYQYFADIRFWQPTAKTALHTEYPQHFFSSLYNLAACVL